MKLQTLLGILALQLAFTACSAFASSQQLLAFDGVESIKFSVVVGGPLDLENGGMFLFGGDKDRARDFIDSMTDSVADRLAPCGISVDSNQVEELRLALYGRPIDPTVGQPTGYVYLMRLERFNNSLESEEECPSVDIIDSTIGVATDRELESVLKEKALRMIGSELRDCSSAGS